MPVAATDAPSSPPVSTLVVDDLSRRFGRRWALARVSLTVPAGGGLLLLGANGSGKTTLLRTLATALRPHRGSASLGGRDLWEDRRALRPRIALLTHAPGLYADLSAAENLRAWAAMGGHAVDAAARLAEVGLTDAADRVVRTFSAGMVRRLALARILLKSPDLVLLDEPFSALDPEGRAVVAKAAQAVRARGATLVLSTHHAPLAASLCDQAIRLHEGQIVWRGAPDDPQAAVPADGALV